MRIESTESASGDFRSSKQFLWTHKGRIVIGVILIAILFDMMRVVVSYQREQRIAGKIRAVRGEVRFDDFTPPWMPQLLRGRMPVYQRVNYVSLERAAVATEILEDLASLKFLDSLELHYTQFNAIGAESLRGTRGIRLLKIAGTQIGDAELEFLRFHTSLEYLDLSSTRVTDSGLKRLAGLTKLRHLKLNHTQVTDAGLKQLSRLPLLEGIELVNTKITDAGLEILKEFPRLYGVRLERTNTTSEGRSYFSDLFRQKLSLLPKGSQSPISRRRW
jgi:hypothetical protein